MQSNIYSKPSNSKEIGKALITRFEEARLEIKITEAKGIQSEPLFVPSSKCPKAFIRERIDVSPDNPSWIIRKMNTDYTEELTKLTGGTKEILILEEEPESRSSTVLDTVSLSTDLAPYMDSCAETLASNSLSTDSKSSNSQLEDITVISLSSDDDESVINCHNHTLDSVLKDSNSLNSNLSPDKHNISRSRSFTLDCPSPLLIDALIKNRIGLEPSSNSDIIPNENSTGTNTSKPKGRMPVCRSLMFSLAEKRDHEGTASEETAISETKSEVSNLTQITETKELHKETKPEYIKTSCDEGKTGKSVLITSVPQLTDVPMPILKIKKKYNESSSFFCDPSFIADSLMSNSAKVSECDIKSTILEEADEISKPYVECFKSIEEEESDPTEIIKASISEDFVDETLNVSLKDINVLLDKQKSFKQFLNDFSHKEQSRTFLINRSEVEEITNNFDSLFQAQISQQQEEIGQLKQKLEQLENYMKEIRPLEIQEYYSSLLTQISSQEKEINQLKQKLQDFQSRVSKVDSLEKKFRQQERSISLLKSQLRTQEKDQIDWMESLFERKFQQQMEDLRQHLELDDCEDFSSLPNIRDTPTSENTRLMVADNFINPKSDEEIQGNVPSIESSLNSVKTLIQAAESPCKNPFSERQFLMLNHLETTEIIKTPEIALNPEMKPKFDKISAIAKGFLTRRLMKTLKVQGIIKTIKDTTATALQIHADLDKDPPKSRSILNQDVQLSKRLLNQLNAACHEFSDIFFKYSIKEQMILLAQSRELRKNPRPKKEFITRTKKISRTRSLTPQNKHNPINKFQKKKNEFSPTIFNARNKRSPASASPKRLNRRVSRISIGNSPMAQRSYTACPSFNIETQQKDPKLLSFDHRSPSFLL